MRKVIYPSSNRVWFSFSSLDDVLSRNWLLVDNLPSNGKDYFIFECTLSDSPLFIMRISLQRVMQFDFLSGEFEEDVDFCDCGLYRGSFRFGGKRFFIGSRPIKRSEIQELYTRLCSCVNV